MKNDKRGFVRIEVYRDGMKVSVDRRLGEEETLILMGDIVRNPERVIAKISTVEEGVHV